jgi:hypothetical protein
MVIQNERKLGIQMSQFGKLPQAIDRLIPFLTAIRSLEHSYRLDPA